MNEVYFFRCVHPKKLFKFIIHKKLEVIQIQESKSDCEIARKKSIQQRRAIKLQLSDISNGNSDELKNALRNNLLAK